MKRSAMAVALFLVALPGCASHKSPAAPSARTDSGAGRRSPSGKIDAGTVSGTATVQRINLKLKTRHVTLKGSRSPA